MSSTNGVTLAGYKSPNYQNGSASTQAIDNMSKQNSIVTKTKGGSSSSSTIKFDNVPSGAASANSNYKPSDTGAKLASTSMNMQRQQQSATSGGSKKRKRRKGQTKKRRHITCRKKRKNKSRRRK